MQIPNGSHFSHGSLKVFERSWQHGGKHDSATLGILVCWLCDSVMWEDSHGSGAGDRRTGSPRSAALVLSKKQQQQQQKSKICHCKAGTLQKFTATQMPPGRWGMGDGGWGMGVGGQCINWQRVAALLKDGLSVPLVSDSKLTSSETRVEACGVTWRRSHPIFFTSAWWNAAANVLRPRPLRSAWKKKKKGKLSVRWALVRSNKRPQNIFDSFLVGQMKGTSLCHFVPFIFSRSCSQS